MDSTSGTLIFGQDKSSTGSLVAEEISRASQRAVGWCSRLLLELRLSIQLTKPGLHSFSPGPNQPLEKDKARFSWTGLAGLYG